VKITVCASCAGGQSGFADRLAGAITRAGIAAEVGTVDCLSGCARPSALSVRDTGKTAYLFGDLDDADLPNLLTFARLYAESQDGNLADARVLGALRMKALARIPG
jgi:predicted metal-binding protein